MPLLCARWPVVCTPACVQSFTHNPNAGRQALFLTHHFRGACFGDANIIGTGYPFDPFKNPGPSDCPEGNPINPGIGNKYQAERDWSDAGAGHDGLLSFERHYNSSRAVAGSELGERWRHSFSRSIYAPNGLTAATVMVYRADGRPPRANVP